MTQLSILIPSRSEPYLQQTIDDIFRHSEGDTEVIVGLDGEENGYFLSNPAKSSRILWFAEKEPIGQRAMTNKLANLSNGKYLMKLDAHCSLSQGFDVKMIEAMEDNMVMTGLNMILDAPNWNIQARPFTTKYYFDQELVFQNYPDFPRGEGEMVETMTIPGSMFMITREKYHELNICDEAFGSWGFQGVETSCKMWLSGGKVVTNRDVFYGHMFRTEKIPYERKAEDVLKAQNYAKKQFIEGKWKSKRPLSWLVDKFNPPGWDKEALDFIHK